MKSIHIQKEKENKTMTDMKKMNEQEAAQVAGGV